MVTIVWPPGAFGAFITAALDGACVLVAIGSPGIGPARRWIVLAAVLLSVAVAGLASSSLLAAARDFLNAGVIALLPLVIVVRFRRALYVNAQTVLGAVCVYVVIGMLFANVDSGVGHLSSRPYFAGTSSATSSQYMYFSLITLSTVGYGDLTPGLGVGRALAVTEALMGQLYLVTVIALLVSNFGQGRQSRGRGSTSSD
jgi:hypothetical protein